MKQILRTGFVRIPFPRQPGRPSLWRHRDLRLVIPARTLSYVGDTLAMIALTLRVHDQGGGAVGIALLMAAFALPSVLMMGVAGAVAEAYLSTPKHLLGGGTVEIQLNVIAEHVLGLPRG